MQHLLHAGELKHVVCEVIDIGLLERYERPLPVMNEYDQLLHGGRRTVSNPACPTTGGHHQAALQGAAHADDRDCSSAVWQSRR